MVKMDNEEFTQTIYKNRNHPDVLTEKEKTFRSKTIDAPLRQQSINLESRMQAIRDAQEARSNVTFKMGLFDHAKPFLIGGLLLFFIIGPGVSAIMQIIGSMNLWYWVGFIILGILLWRNY